MIEFKGELSNGAKKLILMKEIHASACVASLVAILFSVATVIISLFTDKIILLFLILYISFIVLSCIPYKKTINKLVPNSITIEGGMIYLKNEMIGASRKVSDVKKIFDFGEWYYIIFNFPHKNLLYLCQKNLLNLGSIEEFEALFEGKIIKKNR